MKRILGRTWTATAALLLVGSFAAAQDISTSLPLTSIGDRLMWSVSDQTLNLNVPVSGQIRLELYSPRVDPRDYRSDTYYGDETYTAGSAATQSTAAKTTTNATPEPVSTTFTLLSADGKAVLSRTFAPGAQAWETLLDQTLPAGQYRLLAQTRGNGKNTFAVRLAGVSAVLSADRLSVNVHSRDWVPVLNVRTDGAGYVLKMYDGDGPQELEARLRDAAGRVYPLAVSPDLTWSDLPLPSAAGAYTVELRQPTSAKQFSNTVSFALNRAGTQTPLTLGQVDQTGVLRVQAQLLLPTGSVPTAANVLVGADALSVPGQVERPVAAGTYPVTAAQVSGAQVTLSPSTVTVPRGGVGEVAVQVRPQVALSLSSDKPEVCLGDTVTLTARATTAYPGLLPLDLSLDTPGLTVSGQPILKGELSASQPGELQVRVTPTQAGPMTVQAQLSPWGQTQALTLNVRPEATSLQLWRLPLPAAQTGDTVTVRLNVTNSATVAMPFTLSDEVPSGLQALQAPTFSGTLEPGETRELSYQAKVLMPDAATLPLQATLNSPACPAPQQAGGTLAVTPLPPVQAPTAMRRSTISLPFDAPAQTRTLTVAHRPPADASYVSGSSTLNGQPLADPLRGPSGTLYWTVPNAGGALRGVITYDLSHTGALDTLARPALSATFGAERREVLEGQFDAADFAQAGPLNAAAAPDELAENAGAIKLPLNGSTVRIRDRINVTVEAPLGPVPPLTVGGVAVSPDLIGTNTQDGVTGTQRLTFVGVPIQSGPNVLRFLNQEVTVNRIGATSRVEVTPVNMIADGSTPVRVKLRTLDAFGQLSGQSSVTVNSNLEPITADANPGESGYQVKVVDGEGVLELRPQSAPVTLNLAVQLGQKTERYTFEVRPDTARVGVGVISATAGLTSGFTVANNVTLQAHGYYEGPLAGGKLYIAADKDSLPTDTNPLVRAPVYGDASTESVPLQGIDPVALTYDHPNFRADYRRTSLPIDVLPVGEQLTALTLSSKANPQVSGFVAAVPSARVTNVPVVPQGTRVLHLPNGNISEGSETLVLVTLERGTGKLLRSVTLARNTDYVLDTGSGVVTLSRPLDHVDADLNEQLVYASYRLGSDTSNRRLAFGVQAKKTGEHYTVGVAAVSLDQAVTFGARATYDNGTTRADGLLAYSGGLQASGSVSSAPNARTSFGATLRYQQAGYAGLGASNVGLYLTGNATVAVGPRLNVVTSAEYHNVPESVVSTDPLLDLTAPETARGGSVSTRAEYKLNPFTVGLGGTYAFGDIYGVGAVGSVGYQGERTSVSVVHTQPLSGNLNASTDIAARFSVSRNVTLGFVDKVTWGLGQAAALTLDSAVGNVNYSAGYELPTASGEGNRARFSVGTTLPLGKNLALGVRGSALYSMVTHSAELGGGADLNYKTDRISATVGTDLSQNAQGFGVVVRGGVTGSLSDQLTLTADGLAEYGQTRDGRRLSVGYAYRARNLASLGYVRYVDGTLAGNTPELNAGLSAEYHRARWAVRGGADTRTLLSDADSFTWQTYAGVTAYPTDWLGLSAWGRTIQQPASNYAGTGYGVEGSVRALPGTWLSAGYNFKGFDGLPSAGTYTRQGAYVRLDLTLDESLGRK